MLIKWTPLQDAWCKSLLTEINPVPAIPDPLDQDFSGGVFLAAGRER